MTQTMQWSTEELNRIDAAQEMHIAAARADGSLRKPVIVWMVRLGGELYTRSVNGPDAAWFRGTRARREGHITAGGIDKDVAFIDVDPSDPINAELDAAYRSKYRNYSSPVAAITSPLARSTTLEVVPRA